jgi:hypothetical protein
VNSDSSEEYLAATYSSEEHEEEVSRGDDNNQRTIDIFAFADEAQQVMVTATTKPAMRWLGTGRTATEAQGMVVALKKEDRSCHLRPAGQFRV